MPPGRWAIERERFHLPRERQTAEPAPSTPIGEVIPGLLKQVGLADRLWEQTLLAEWSSLVGDQVARRARPGRMHRGTLVIFVSNSAWLSELSRYGQQQILENIQKRFGAGRIQGIRLQLDPDLPGPVKRGVPPGRTQDLG